MKKYLFFIPILFLMFISRVNAEDWYFITGLGGNSVPNNTFCESTGNLQGPCKVRTNNNNFLYTLAESGEVPQSEVSRYVVKSSFCVASAPENANYNLTNVTAVNSVRINNYYVENESKQCVTTDSSGNVWVGTNVLSIYIDFTFLQSSGTHHISATLHSSSQYGTATFYGHNILDSIQIQSNENTQVIVNNQDDNTQDIIDNQNANTDRQISNDNANTTRQINNDNNNTQSIINNQNSNSQAEQQAINNNTDAVNGLNNSVNNTDTTGSENALSSIVNDPAFQDTTGINSIITLPVNMISSLSNTCQPININIPFINSNVSLPCFRSIITQHMPVVANLIGIVINGFILYRILIDIVGIVKSARNPDEDRLDVLEL